MLGGRQVVEPTAGALLAAMGSARVAHKGDYEWKGGEEAALQQLEAYCTRAGATWRDVLIGN